MIRTMQSKESRQGSRRSSAALAKISAAVLTALLLSHCRTEPYQAPIAAQEPVQPTPLPGVQPVQPTPGFHTVEKGDTLYNIAQRYRLNPKDLAGWNGIDPTGNIQLGQQLRLTPPEAGAVAGAPGPEGSTAKGVESAAPGSVKTEPKAGKVPYSPDTLAQMEKQGAAAAGEADKPSTEGGTADKPESKPESGGPDNEQLEWGWPTKGKISERFSVATKGLQINGSLGQPIYASAAGQVSYAGSSLHGYGKMIVIKHNKIYLSVYAHNSQILVKEGQLVAKGQKIAEMGNSDSDQVNLHFEIRRLGKPVDPMNYLPSDKSS
jgi:lipoprotein NlpD